MELGKCLLEQRGPELLVRVRVDEGEPGVPGAGELVVNDHLYPVPVLPEPEAEHSAVSALLAETLACCKHLVQRPGLSGKGRQGGQQPAVTKLALDHIKLAIRGQ